MGPESVQKRVFSGADIHRETFKPTQPTLGDLLRGNPQEDKT